MNKNWLISLFPLLILSVVNVCAAQEQNWAIRVPQATFATSINNQDLKQQELETQERIIAELRKLRQQVESLETQVKATSDTVEIYKKIEEARQIQIAVLKSALEDVKKYDELAQRKEELYKQEVALLNAEVARLRSDLASAKRSKFLNKVLSTVITVGALYVAAK